MKISVVMPAYNPGDYIELAIESLVAQTHSDWECIVVDDGSKEDLSRVEKMDSRVRLIRQKNKGASVARNVAMLASEGEYLALLDSDDVWYPEKLARQIELLENNAHFGMCHSAHDVINERGEISGPGFGRDIQNYVGLLASNSICASTVVFRRSCLAESGLMDPLLRFNQDFDMWLKIAMHHDIGFVPTPLAGYRVHSSNISSRVQESLDEQFGILRSHIREARLVGNTQAEAAAKSNFKPTRGAWGAKAYDRSRVALGQRDFAQARKYLWLSLRLAPAYTLRSLANYGLQQGTKKFRR